VGERNQVGRTINRRKRGMEIRGGVRAAFWRLSANANAADHMAYGVKEVRNADVL
jgi:hypothetical protein